jgi:hypothetical protein
MKLEMSGYFVCSTPERTRAVRGLQMTRYVELSHQDNSLIAGGKLVCILFDWTGNLVALSTKAKKCSGGRNFKSECG